MATKGKRPMRALTPSDKIEAIQRVNDGESKASVARDIGVPESTLRGWCKNEDKLRYMTSRLSSSDTDKSNDGEPPDKRGRTESPVAPSSPVAAGLDLTTPTTSSATVHTAQHTSAPIDAPVELTTKRSQPSPTSHLPRDRRPDPGASVSMGATSAISPLTGIPHLSGLTHSHLALSFNEIANNLTLLAHLTPGLSALSAQPASRALRSVRSPKPAHNGVLNLNESKHRSKPHHSSDPYRPSGSRSSHHSSHTVASTSSSGSQPIDDTLWYWLKRQQAMLDMTAQTSTSHQMRLGKIDPTTASKPVVPVPPLGSHLDYNQNTWLWQYYKQIGGAMPPPDDKHKSASQVPRDKSSENILYSHLTKAKEDEQSTLANSLQPQMQNEIAMHSSHKEPRVAEPAASPEISTENKEPVPERCHESSRSQTKARTVLDNLLFNNTNHTVTKEAKNVDLPNGEWDTGTVEALEHGDKFLAWLEASGDPSVTRMHVHQLRVLLQNLRARRSAAAVPAEPSDHAARRK